MKVSPQQITAFTQAARERSFTKAARTLGVTQSAVTQHVSKLERLMGTQLFVRRRNGLELTRPALELFALSDRMRTVEQLIAEKLQTYSSMSTGHLEIIANAPRPALPLLADYGQRYPNVRLSFTLCSWTLAMEKVRRREIDVAIITEPERMEGLFVQELAKSRYLAYMRHDNPLARRKSISLKQLNDLPVILPEEGSLTQRVVQEGLKAHDLTLNRIVEMTSFPMVREAVLHGIGVGILLDTSFYPTPQLVTLPIKEIGQTFRTYLVAPADKSDLRFVRSFIDISTEMITAKNG